MALICTSNLTASESTKMYVLDCGQIRLSHVGVSLMTGRWFHEDFAKGKELGNPCYLFKKGDFEFLWETGIPDSVSELPNGDTPNPGFNFKMQKTLLTSLAELNLTPEDIDVVAVSHMHDDHAGNLNYFKKSKILIQQDEHAAAYARLSKYRYHMNPKYYNELDQNQFTLLEGEYDVFGDSSVVIQKTEGHTPGHQSLYVSLESGPIVISGDLYHFQEARDNQRPPMGILVNHCNGDALESMRRTENYVEQVEGEIWIQHDINRFKMTRLAPEFYNVISN